VRATKLDVSGSSVACPGALPGLVPSVDPDGDEPGESGEDRLFRTVKVASSRGMRSSTLSSRLPQYSPAIMNYSPLVFNGVLDVLLDPYRQVCPCPSHPTSPRSLSASVRSFFVFFFQVHLADHRCCV
jgi:hypothetical protein